MFDDPFQAGLISFFIIAAVAGVAVFAINPNLIGGGTTPGERNATVSIWGTISSESMDTTLDNAGIRDDDSLKINYTQIDPSDIRNRVVNALARNEGPDALLYPHTRLLQLEEFVTKLGPRWYSPRQFRDNFVEGTEIFMRPEGATALPFAMDPLVMYWNRDMLSEADFVSPPETWSQLSNYISKITEVDQAENIDRSAVALGTTQNITQSQEILSALFFQAGNSIISVDESGRSSVNLINPTENTQQSEAALRLYTQFANPATKTYTWNNNLPQDRRAFISNRVAMYFDSGQAVTEVRERNPNLNFDVAQMPQREDGEPRTYARMYGLAMLERVPPQRKARVFSALRELTSPSVVESMLANTNLTPVHKEIVANASPEDAYKATFLDAAITARGWLDPEPDQSDAIFADMVSDVISGQNDISSAVNVTGKSLETLLNN